MKLERSQPEDGKEFTEWMVSNLFLNDCTIRTLKGCTFFKIAGILYLPVKVVLMLESLAPNPAVTGTKRLLALRRAMDDLQNLYPNIEIVFLTRKDVRLAECARSYGFEELDYAVYRFMAAPEDRRREKKTTSSATETSLRQYTRGDGAPHTLATRTVRDLPGTIRAGTETVQRPHQGNQDGAGNPMPALQPGDRARL